jgi:hypothetical protein
MALPGMIDKKAGKKQYKKWVNAIAGLSVQDKRRDK